MKKVQRDQLSEELRRKEIDDTLMEKILSNREWETSTNKENNHRIIYKKIWIRPTIKIHDKINEVLNRNDFVENKVIDIKKIWSKEFRDFVKSLDLYKRTDIMKFYKTMNALLNYKENEK